VNEACSETGAIAIEATMTTHQDLAMTSTWNATSRSRTIKVPSDALMIFEGNNTEYASRSIDSGAATIYEFSSKRVTLPGRTSQSLRTLYGLGNVALRFDLKACP
jgi:hypothetical protein